MLPLTHVVTSLTMAIVLATVPVPPVAMVTMLILHVFFVMSPVIAKMAAPGVVLAGRPPRSMSCAVVVVWNAVIITTARDSRVCAISMDGRRAAQQQACGEQGRLNGTALP